MKIVLLNNNPVVGKLVTLSVQKTSDELRIAENIEAIEFGDYDLFIIDDALYSEDAMDEVRSKIDFKTSLFICSKDAKEQDGFTKILKKPFLPTDLVETLISLAKIAASQKLADDIVIQDDVLDDDFFNDFDDVVDDLEDIGSLEEVQEVDGVETLDEDLLDFDFSDDVQEEGVLDRDELQEVQSLLEETEDLQDTKEFDDFDFGDNKEEIVLDLENIKDDEDFDLEEIIEESETDGAFDEPKALEELSFEDDFSFEEDEQGKEIEPQEEIFEEQEESFEDEMLGMDEEEPSEENLNEEELASQIQEAVDSLSDEDLQKELDEDILLNIGSLTSRDLKLAIGEEVNEEPPLVVCAKESEVKSSVEKPEGSSGANGIEALKKLLNILSQDDVAASLKGMKININITLGDA